MDNVQNTPVTPNPDKTHDVNNMVGSSRIMRRRLVMAILIYCACLVSYIAYSCHTGSGNSTLTTIVTCSFALCGTVVSAYLGTSAYEDRNFIDKHFDDIGGMR